LLSLATPFLSLLFQQDLDVFRIFLNSYTQLSHGLTVAEKSYRCDTQLFIALSLVHTMISGLRIWFVGIELEHH